MLVKYLWIDAVPVETFFFETRPKSKHFVTRDVISISDAVHVLPKVGFRGGQLHWAHPYFSVLLLFMFFIHFVEVKMSHCTAASPWTLFLSYTYLSILRSSDNSNSGEGSLLLWFPVYSSHTGARATKQFACFVWTHFLWILIYFTVPPFVSLPK